MDIYKRKSHFKKFLLLFALLIVVFTLFYTNTLVKKLEERERKIIDLYAKGMQAIVSSENISDVGFMFSEIIEANNSIPVILTDENFNPIPGRYRNIDIPKNSSEEQIEELLKCELEEMKEQHEPILVSHEDVFKNYVFYKNSTLLTQLKYFPLIQILIGMSFIGIAYLAFSYSRKSEQNKVWVGMAKETAHQLGTPLSSMMAWMDYLADSDKFKNEIVTIELSKDVERLKVITERFSNIGSEPALTLTDIKEVCTDYVDYIKIRVSKKVQFSVQGKDDMLCLVNKSLFDWVLENLIKNAVDAMEGNGKVTILLSEEYNKVKVEVADTGKGMTSDQKKQVFNPGFTTKKRGWGLGLTLSKRIIEDYHRGKIFVKSSDSNGTIFAIYLNKN